MILQTKPSTVNCSRELEKEKLLGGMRIADIENELCMVDGEVLDDLCKKMGVSVNTTVRCEEVLKVKYRSKSVSFVKAWQMATRPNRLCKRVL